MSVKALDRVWDFSPSRGAARLVLLALADWADDDGFCYPGLVAIARKARLSKSSVVHVLKRLAAAGEIQITVRGHAQPDPVKDEIGKLGGWQPTNYYRVTPAGKVVQSEDRPQKRTGSPKHARKVVHSIAEGGPIGATHIRNEPSLDPSVQPSERTARVARHLAFKGARLSVPRFLHEQFTDQLGPKGRERFDLLAWYAALDRRDDGPIVGDVLAFIRKAFGEESRRRLGSGGALPSGYGDWSCPHTPTCSHPTRCRNLVAIGRTA